MMSMFRITGLTFVAIVVLLSACSSAPKKPEVALRPWQKTSTIKGYTEKSVEAFGTSFVLRVWPSNTPTVTELDALKLAEAEISRIVRMTEGDIVGGEVNQINSKAGTQAVPVSKELADLLVEADLMYQLSDKRFDITYTIFNNSSEKDLKKNHRTDWDSTGSVAKEAIRLFGDQNMILDLKPTPQVRLYDQRTKLNLRGMIRGYVAEKVIKILIEQGLGGAAVIVDGFFAAIGTPLRDPAFMCIENPSALGQCLYRISPTDFNKVFYLGMSASKERQGKIFNPKEAWTLRSGGVVVSGERGSKVQFAATITAVMDDAKLETFFEKVKPLKVYGAFFLVNQNGNLNGSLQPIANLSRLNQR